MPPPWALTQNHWVKDLDPSKHDTKTAFRAPLSTESTAISSVAPPKKPSLAATPTFRSAGRVETLDSPLGLGLGLSALRESSDVVFPMGDFRISERASSRRLQTMMGITPRVERRELMILEQLPSERPKTDSEKWEGDRQRSQKVSVEASAIAMKRDDGAWTDADGYQQSREPPAFRDGFNNTLRVKPPPETHLFNGLKQMQQRATGMEGTAAGPLLHSWTKATTTNHAQRQLLKHSGRGHQGNALAPARSAKMVHRVPLHAELSVTQPARLTGSSAQADSRNEAQLHRLSLHPELDIDQPARPATEAGASARSSQQFHRPSSGSDLQIAWPQKLLAAGISQGVGADSRGGKAQVHRENMNPELFPKVQGPEDAGAVAQARVQDLVHRLSLRQDVAAALGAYFLRGITSELSGLKTGRGNAAASEFRREHGTAQLEGSGALGEVAGRGGADTEVDGVRSQGEIELLIKTLSCEEAPVGHLSASATAEETKRSELALSRTLGNAFVALGMTLPAGPRDDALRSDSVALAMGNRIMGPEGIRDASGFPLVSEGIRREVAIALGRALLHLRMASVGIEGGRGKSARSDKKIRDRDLRTSIGRLTLQLLEATAARSGKSLTKDPRRREILAIALGSAVLHLEASSSRGHTTDRNQSEAPLLISKSLPMGPEGSIKTSSLVRMNKPIETLLRRPMLPGRDSAPSTVPRHIPISAR